MASLTYVTGLRICYKSRNCRKNVLNWLKDASKHYVVQCHVAVATKWVLWLFTNWTIFFYYRKAISLCLICNCCNCKGITTVFLCNVAAVFLANHGNEIFANIIQSISAWSIVIIMLVIYNTCSVVYDDDRRKSQVYQ